ncbi:MAG: hypothetical protein R3D02_05800 [Hyphomicrobiales bacterium]
MFRKLLALSIFITAPGIALAQGGGWQGGPGGDGSFAAAPACAGCTAPALQFSCRSSDKQVRLTVGLPLSGGGEGQKVDLIFSIDGLVDVRRGYRYRDPAAGLLGATDITIDDGLIAALKLGKTATVTLDEQTIQVPLAGSAEAFKAMRAACGAAPVPEREQ